jgi:signal transduction histidine kinase/CheY-like chemotaxis protein
VYASLDAPIALRALLSAPLDRDGRWTASFWAGSDQPRPWSTAEVELVEVIAGRSWQLLEQARIAAALLRSEARLSQELASTQRLQAIGARLVRGGDLQPLLNEILAASAEIAGTDKGNIQFLDSRTGALRIVAHQGLGERLLRHFAEAGWHATSEGAARLERVILEDVEQAPGAFGTEDLEVVLADGIRAITSTPLLSRDGRLLGMLSNHFRQPHRPSPNELRFLDLLARMAADLVERQQAEDALREADRRKDEFLATLAHELRNPLAPIRNAAHILRARDSGGPDARWAHAVIDRQLGHLVRLVDDLLEVGRIKRGTIELRRGRAELSAVLTSAVETVRPLVDEARQGLVLDLPAEPLSLLGDGVRLTQVFANLLDNATKYTPAGGRISIGVRREPAFVEVSVADTGPGIPRDKLEEVFEMFAQVDGPLERRQPGLGIGLHLVKRIVELHGGSVVAKSEGEGRGSEFVVRLPLDDAAAEAPGPALAAPRPASAPRPLPSGRAPRVLVVDDNRDAVESLSLLLRLEGCETEVAYAGAEALSKARGFRPDVVLLDIGLPVMNGYEVCRALRREPRHGTIRIVALTGWGQERDRQRATEAGFDAHLVKPVDPAALAALLTAGPAPPRAGH